MYMINPYSNSQMIFTYAILSCVAAYGATAQRRKLTLGSSLGSLLSPRSAVFLGRLLPFLAPTAVFAHGSTISANIVEWLYHSGPKHDWYFNLTTIFFWTNYTSSLKWQQVHDTLKRRIFTVKVIRWNKIRIYVIFSNYNYSPVLHQPQAQLQSAAALTIY